MTSRSWTTFSKSLCWVRSFVFFIEEISLSILETIEFVSIALFIRFYWLETFARCRSNSSQLIDFVLQRTWFITNFITSSRISFRFSWRIFYSFVTYSWRDSISLNRSLIDDQSLTKKMYRFTSISTTSMTQLKLIDSSLESWSSIKSQRFAWLVLFKMRRSSKWISMFVKSIASIWRCFKAWISLDEKVNTCRI